jgi:citrate lyase subunit beta/citryl-CoA lyase
MPIPRQTLALQPSVNGARLCHKRSAGLHNLVVDPNREMPPMHPDPRSYLFVPADRPERIAKALAAGADAVIVDLEDAVAPQAKDGARAALAAWLAAAPAAPGVVVRINGADSAAFGADLAVCAAPAVAAVMLPKAGLDGDLAALRRVLPDKPVIATVETAEGYDRMRATARAAGVVRLAFGTIDFRLDLGIAGDDEAALLAFRARFVLESRLARLGAPVDGVTTVVDDVEQVARDAAASRRLGFGAKLCIHPRQVDAVNRAYSPDEAELDWAQRVVDAAARAAGAAVAVGRSPGAAARRGAAAPAARVKQRG